MVSKYMVKYRRKRKGETDRQRQNGSCSVETGRSKEVKPLRSGLR